MLTKNKIDNPFTEERNCLVEGKREKEGWKEGWEEKREEWDRT